MPAATPPATPQPDLAALHTRLLAAILDPQLTLSALAEMFNLAITDIARWFNSPQAQADLDLIRNLARDRARLLADLQLPAAVDTLIHLNDRLIQLEPAPEEPITTHLRLADTIRKTTTALHRFASKPAAGGAALQSGHGGMALGAAALQNGPSGTSASPAPAPQGQPQVPPPPSHAPRPRDRPIPHAAAA